MGGVAGEVGFVNAPLTASEVRNFKKELGNLVEDPVGISNQVDQFLGPNTYTWGEMNSILKILFSPEEIRMIRTAGMKTWEKENRTGPPGDYKLPVVDPRWDPNREEDRRSMDDYRSLIVKDPDSPEGQVLLKTQFVTKSWPDIRRKLEKIEDWQEKDVNELLREALKVYLRREEEKTKTKAKIMVAVAREAIQDQNPPNRRSTKSGGGRALPPWKTPGRPGEDRKCFYCGEVGHIRRECQKLSFDEAITKEQDALEKLLKGENNED
ncbi:hypothetical protein DUI87_28147 [Hirundo rustica rustica]|uniref:CCHC-type domain-containing protein n=1 Tax=Hirundo rustica rustica TaxID=333673 RepID=A0A3M0J3D4_HIRRU|nr:hypothetical protein DUI87_28147 [Hirundo rustica rustica]